VALLIAHFIKKRLGEDKPNKFGLKEALAYIEENKEVLSPRKWKGE
jgi:hypothetical protein